MQVWTGSHTGTAQATAQRVRVLDGTGTTGVNDGVGSVWQVRIDWGYEIISGVWGHVYTTGARPLGNPRCWVSTAVGVSVSLHGPCTWYGQIPAWTAGQGFGVSEDFTVSGTIFGVGIHADHYLNGETLGDGETCHSDDTDSGSCHW